MGCSRGRLLAALLLPPTLLLGALGSAAAQQESTGEASSAALAALTGRMLVVGTKEAAPFSIKREDGSWTGIAHELWKQIADSLKLSYEIREMPLDMLLDSVSAGSLDAVVGAVTITPEREARLDFSHPFQVTGLAIAVSSERANGWIAVLRRFLSRQFLFLVLGMLVVLLMVGTLVWLFERHRNPEQFGGTLAQGLGSSMWWSMVTMTTVGYGDLAPRTAGGRIIGIMWMFAALILVSSFTASITSALTLGELQSPVKGPNDLSSVRVATVEGSTSADYLAGRDISFASYEDAEQALQSLQNGRSEAVVYDEPIMRYMIGEHADWRIRVLPESFERQYYGIAMPTYSPLREPVNRLLLQIIESPQWKRVLMRYLGR